MPPTSNRVFFLLLLLLAGNLPTSNLAGQSPDAAPVDYEIGFAQHNLNYITLDATIQSTSDQTELMMAVWTPGSYLVREFARHIDSFSATDSIGEPLDWKKTKKNRWVVETDGIESFQVSYRLYCNDLSVRTNFVDGEFALINGAATFLTVPQYLDKPHQVRLQLPERWSRSATSLDAVSGKHAYVAANFDELVDSPIVAGSIEIYPFEAGGVPHQLVNVGDSSAWDGAAVANDLKKMVEAQHELWGVVPYRRYLFINMICGSGGGLEHNNSTVIMTDTWTYRVKDRYKRWLSLASHEFFHTWNVRRLRPKALMNYDYENETYFPSLWIAEGITSYYQSLILVRSGLISKKEYLKGLNRNIESVQSRPGRLKQSLRESSFDTWIKFYRPSPNSRDTQISYYSKGAVVGFLLDTEIQKLTKGKKSLDDVMRVMYEKFQSTGYDEDDFRKVVAKVSGEDLSEFFDRYVDSTDELEFDTVRDWFGFRFRDEDESDQAEDETDTETSEADSPDAEDEQATEEGKQQDVEDEQDAEDEQELPWLGFQLNGGKVRRIEPDSPAENCGLNNGDELLAIDGYRIDGNLSEKIEQLKVGDQLEVLISRRQKLMTKMMVVAAEPESRDWELKELKNPTEDQQQQLKAWLGISTDEVD